MQLHDFNSHFLTRMNHTRIFINQTRIFLKSYPHVYMHSIVTNKNIFINIHIYQSIRISAAASKFLFTDSIVLLWYLLLKFCVWNTIQIDHIMKNRFIISIIMIHNQSPNSQLFIDTLTIHLAHQMMEIWSHEIRY